MESNQPPAGDHPAVTATLALMDGLDRVASAPQGSLPGDRLPDLTNPDQVLSLQDRKTIPVPVPEWGFMVHVRGLTGAERDAWESSFVTGSGARQKVSTANVRAKLVARCVVNPATGGSLFGTEHVVRLGEKSAAALARVYDVAAKLSGVTKDDVEELAGD